MASPIPLTNGYVGMRRDVPRDEMAPSVAWYMQDLIPARDGSASRGRFGYGLYGGQVFNTGTNVPAVGVWRGGDTNTTNMLAVTSDGTLWVQTPTTSSSTASTVPIPIQVPVLYRQKTYFMDGSAAIKTYNGSVVGTAAGSPPTARVATVYKDHLVVAYTAAQPQRIWFANGGDPTTWNTAANGQWMDASMPVYGLCTLPNMILVFGQNRIERIRGDIIPGVSGSDFVREPLFNVGCETPATIATYNNTAIWTTASGVYQTDGSTMRDLTLLYGVKQEWTGNLNTSGGRCAVVYDGKYILCTGGKSWVFDMVAGTAYRLSNQNFLMMACSDLVSTSGIGGYTGNLIAGGDSINGSATYDLSVMFGSGGTLQQYGMDAKTASTYTAFTPTIETPYYKPFFYRRKVYPISGIKVFKNGYLELVTGYNQTSNAINFRVSTTKDEYAGTPQQYNTTYSKVQDFSIAANTGGLTKKRLKFPVNLRSEGVAFKFEYQNVASGTNNVSDFRLGTFDLEVMAQERSRVS